VTFSDSTNSLMQRLQQAAPELVSACERVDLKPGPWPGPDGKNDDCLYFPETSFLALSLPYSTGGSSTPQSARLALLGRHSVWSPRQALSSDFLAEVLVPGHAMRVSDSVVRAVKTPLATWWLQVATSNQHLISQMARMTLCAQKHSAPQTLASWLLMVQHNSGASSLQMPMVNLRDWLGWPPDTWQSAWHVLESQGVVTLMGQGPSAKIQIKALEASGFACACHQVAKLYDPGQGSWG
jgi:hypothetical protein